MTAPRSALGLLRAIAAGTALGLAMAPGRAAEPATPAANPWPQAQAAATRDLESARRDLASVQDEIRRERLTLVERVNALRTEVRALRTQATAAQEQSQAASAQATEHQGAMEHLGETTTRLDAALTEARRDLGAVLGAGEAQALAPKLDAIDRQLASATALERVAVAPALLELLTGHAGQALGGARGDGQARDSAGTVCRGRFVQVGPAAYFAADGAGPAGWVVQDPGNLLPSVFTRFDSGAAATAGVRALAASGRGTVPVDPTLGNAVRVLTQTRETLWEHICKGGVIMVPLLGLGLVCVVLSLYKLTSLHFLATSAGAATVHAVVDALRAERIDEAVALAHTLRRPLGPVILAGIEHRNAPKEHIEEILYERILSQVPALERLLSPLAVCASASPLLGLLGTVTGMIHTFKLITVFGTGDPRLLSAGISEALITTEYGLYIAIPALLVHAYLSRRVRKAVAVTQQAAVTFVNGLKLPRPGGS